MIEKEQKQPLPRAEHEDASCRMARHSLHHLLGDVRHGNKKPHPLRQYAPVYPAEMVDIHLLSILPPLSLVMEYDCISSTNNRAKELVEADRMPHNSVILAWEQTAGRGRFDRRFVSPRGCGVYLSYVMRPSWDPSEAAYVTTCAAVAVAEAIESLVQTEVKIKWVNDLWIGEKKICGILTEGAVCTDGTGMRYVVVGIGINVRHAELPAELSEIATSIEAATGVALDPRDVAAAVLHALQRRMRLLTTHAHMDAYRARSALDGKRVTVMRGDEQYPATVRGVGETGELLLTLDDGTETSLSSGEVSIKCLAPLA